MNKEGGSASRDFVDIPTRLAPRESPSYTATLKKVLLTKRKIITEGGGTRPRPSKETEIKA